jgi:NAD(P)-dependent dehydrogenase (short-subunit alcohol dehydrogenase family)
VNAVSSGHIVELFLAEGWDVTVLDDSSSGKVENLREVAGNKKLHIIEGNARVRQHECLNYRGLKPAGSYVLPLPLDRIRVILMQFISNLKDGAFLLYKQ